MGRYLDLLKISGKVGEGEPNKPKKPPASPIANGKSSFLGFLGTPPPTLETIFSANDDTKQPDTATSFAWLIHFTDREPVTVSFSPEVTQAEALANYPDAVAAEPIAPPPANNPPLSEEEQKELVAFLHPILEPDERRTCDQCANLIARRCQAAMRGELETGRRWDYRPATDRLQRCACYAPGTADTDRRKGRERWPGLIHKRSVR